MAPIDQTGYITPTCVTRTVSATDSVSGTYVITYVNVYSTGGSHVVSKKPEPVDLTDWDGLKRWFVGFSGFQSNKKVFRTRKIPALDPKNKRRMQLQKMRDE